MVPIGVSARGCLIFVVVCCAASLVNCGVPSGGDTSQLLDSGASAYKGFVELFTTLIGRKPAIGTGQSAGDFALYDPDPKVMVDRVLASPAYATDGFFNVHRDRLLFELYQQTPQWAADEHSSFCALRKEMQEVAQEDMHGTAGYWKILDYPDRWVPLPPNVADCFFGTTVGDLQKALAGLTPTTAAAQNCAQNSSLLGSYATGYATAINGLGADQAAKAPVDTPQGAAMLAAFITAQVTPNGTAAASVNVSVSTDQAGRPLMTEEYDPAPESASCSFRDVPAAMATWQPTATSTIMVRAKISPKVVGVMANPFWLARNPTNPKNRGMHRSRVVMYSYFCKEVSPAAAVLAGGPAQTVPALAPYFAPDDTHAQASQACYTCHGTMQPLANFFSALDKFDDASEVDDGGADPGRYPGLRYFQMDDALELPGGYWTFTAPGAGSFYGTDGVDYDLMGLQGLANILSDKNFAGPAQCLVNSAWSQLFGGEYIMPDAFKDQALHAFEQGNAKGAPSFTEAVRYILKSDYGQAYYSPTQGRPAFEALLANATPPACSAQDIAAGQTVAQHRCYSCHNTTVASGGLALFHAPDKAPLPIPDPTRKTAYCKVMTGNMPLDGALAGSDKQSALCYLAPQSGPVPTCHASQVAGPDSPMHPLPN